MGRVYPLCADPAPAEGAALCQRPSRSSRRPNPVAPAKPQAAMFCPAAQASPSATASAASCTSIGGSRNSKDSTTGASEPLAGEKEWRSSSWLCHGHGRSVPPLIGLGDLPICRLAGGAPGRCPAPLQSPGLGLSRLAEKPLLRAALHRPGATRHPGVKRPSYIATVEILKSARIFKPKFILISLISN